jgi:hypothetical protein
MWLRAARADSNAAVLEGPHTLLKEPAAENCGLQKRLL